MTPKEKAIDLVGKFQKQIFFHITDERLDIEEAKGCALIAVDELIKATTPLTSTYYWQEVKQEIENL
jgi:hypothetical protein